MKIKYSYFQLRFPKDVAVLLQRIQDELNAVYLDIPFLLPEETKICKFNGGETLVFDNKVFYVASKEVDVCFDDKKYASGRFFGLLNVSSNYPCYVLWTTFWDDNLTTFLSDFNGEYYARTYSNLARASITLKWGDINV